MKEDDRCRLGRRSHRLALLDDRGVRRPRFFDHVRVEAGTVSTLPEPRQDFIANLSARQIDVK